MEDTLPRGKRGSRKAHAGFYFFLSLSPIVYIPFFPRPFKKKGIVLPIPSSLSNHALVIHTYCLRILSGGRGCAAFKTSGCDFCLRKRKKWNSDMWYNFSWRTFSSHHIYFFTSCFSLAPALLKDSSFKHLPLDLATSRIKSQYRRVLCRESNPYSLEDSRVWFSTPPFSQKRIPTILCVQQHVFRMFMGVRLVGVCRSWQSGCLVTPRAVLGLHVSAIVIFSSSFWTQLIHIYHTYLNS